MVEILNIHMSRFSQQPKKASQPTRILELSERVEDGISAINQYGNLTINSMVEKLIGAEQSFDLFHE